VYIGLGGASTRRLQSSPQKVFSVRLTSGQGVEGRGGGNALPASLSRAERGRGMGSSSSFYVNKEIKPAKIDSLIEKDFCAPSKKCFNFCGLCAARSDAEPPGGLGAPPARRFSLQISLSGFVYQIW